MVRRLTVERAPDHLLIDAMKSTSNARRRNYSRRCAFASIAAASIVAKVERTR